MALIQRMTALQVRLNKIPVRLGVPSFQSLLIRHGELDDDLLVENHTDEVFENIKITSVPPRYVGLSVGSGANGISIAQNDFKAVIPRTYSREFLEKDVLFFVVNPPMAEGEVIYNPNTQEPAGGIFCRLVMIDDLKDTVWTVILRQFRDGIDEATGSGEIGY